MTTKDKILALVKNLDENATIEQTIHRLVLLEMVERSLDKINQGRWIDHDELFDRIEKEYEERKVAVVRGRRNGPSGHPKKDRARRPYASMVFIISSARSSREL